MGLKEITKRFCLIDFTFPFIKIAEAIIEHYKPTTVGEMQDALKDIFGPMFEAIYKAN